MKKQLQILRFTAKLLLAFVVVVLVTGLLTAKPALWDSASFSTYRWLHSSMLPLLFVPLLFVHAGVGISVMLNRSKRFNRPRVRTAALVAWGAMGLALTALTLVESKASTQAALALIEPEPGSSRSGLAAGGAAASSGTAGGGRSGVGGAGGATVATEPSAPPTATHAASPATTSSEDPAPRVPAPKPSVRSVAPPRPTAAATASATGPSGPQLIGQRCVGCHGLDVVVAEKRTVAEWSAVLDTMIGYGAQLSPAERRLVLRYLPRK